MKALVYRRPGTPQEALCISDLPVPQPCDNQVLIRTVSSTCGTTDYGRFKDAVAGRRTPLTTRAMDSLVLRSYGRPLGGEAAGIVEQVGGAVTNVSIGDEVFGATPNATGAWGEYALMNADEVCHKPKRLPLEECAALGVSPTVALAAIEHAFPSGPGSLLGARVLVAGASGGVGLYAVQMARAAGAEVTGLCSERSAPAVRNAGAIRVIDYNSTDLSLLETRFDAIIAVNGYQPITVYKRLLVEDGTHVIIGGTGKQIAEGIAAPLLFAGSGKRATSVVYAAARKRLPLISHMVDTGQLTPLIDEIVPVRDLPTEIPRLVSSHARGKTLVALDF